MLNSQKGSSILGILLLLLILTGVGLAGWTVWLNQQTNKSNSGNVGISSPKDSGEKDKIGKLSLDQQLMPAGWTADIIAADRVFVKDGKAQCFVDFMISADVAESNSAAVDQNKQTVEAIKSKGYGVEELPRGKLEISTNGGTKQLDSQVLNVTGNNNPSSQIYSYITNSTSYTHIQLSCPKMLDLESAKKALLAIKVIY